MPDLPDQTETRSAEDWRSLGEQCVRDWNIHKAVFCYKKSLEIDPAQSALWGKTASLATEYRVDDPRSLVNQALEHDPANIEALALKTELASRYRPSESSDNPDEPEVITARSDPGSSRLDDRQIAEATRWIDEALRLKPDDIDLLFRKARCLEGPLEREELAEELYDHILDVIPNKVSTLVDTAQRFSYDELRALACLDRTLTLDSGDMRHWIAAAKQYRELSKFEKAQSCLDRAQAIERDNKQLWSERFYLLKANDRIDEAYEIPLDKTAFKLEVNLQDFLRTGNFGPISLGMTHDQIASKLGVPEGWADPFHPDYELCHLGYGAYPIWTYGGIEFFFGELGDTKSHLTGIYTDHLDLMITKGQIVRLNAWLFDRGNNVLLSEMKQALESERIAYKIDETLIYGQLLLESGIMIGYEYDSNAISVISREN